MTTQKTVLITGFEPFGKETTNPSWEAAKQLQGRELCGAHIEARQLPCVFDVSLSCLYAAIDDVQPDLVIAVGQAGGRPNITVERVAININDASTPDNQGNRPINTPIIATGPAAYFATLPINAIVKSLCEAGIPASISQTAGTFVCNHVMYGLLHHLACIHPEIRGGFIHIPFLPEQAVRYSGAPSMILETIRTALEIAIAGALKNSEDIAINGGTTH
ncbi:MULTISPECIES: pyroglutamyl-peptidase I [Photorhabdus]|uniref:Pyrrolidone-carboxylate peptidase n=1 Tax=Photorhabdus kayaii TaxID=230088 RepID=A0ABX0B5X1_9GAMM|nr:MULTISPECIES: pyroglutamyl-peptidase I [Photorhabdus]MCC8372754.1 pyroglutamyl-peptidase I [Photorhabdus bodei]MCT8352661.1 pyroglutamyl-peptidase I [Photorhabdus kayaii]NDL13495.1 pyroglutamyl-peptidase I [Photorhabdus kayaii]NDL26159.1 pyroglutamyl-peptidase I [Photorhabdus kayaii]RAX07812.1 pyroglutamyl-peptidase I [Photorhabdus sp. HUG-39]